MNKVELMGRLTKDPVIRTSQGDDATKIARYTLAVNRRYQKAGSADNADFIPCVAFGKAADFVEKYLTKGIRIVAVGHLHTGRYVNQQGDTVYTTDVIVEEHYFAETKPGRDNTSRESTVSADGFTEDADGFATIPDDIEGLPFA